MESASRRLNRAIRASPDMSATTSGSSGDEGDEPSGFMRLPYDVRTIIYQIALTRVDTLNIILFPAVRCTNPKAGAPKPPSATLLDRAHLNPIYLRLNKTISSEAIPFLYSRNTFTFDSLEDCQKFTNPAIPGRDLIARICLHRKAMSRPFSRWGALRTFLPSTLKRFTIEIDTYTFSMLDIFQNLCRGLAVCLKQIGDESARRSYFKDVVRIRFPTIKYLQDQVLTAFAACSTSAQKRLWKLFGEALFMDRTAVEQRFKDLLEDGLVRDCVFGAVHWEVGQMDKILKV